MSSPLPSLPVISYSILILIHLRYMQLQEAGLVLVLMAASVLRLGCRSPEGGHQGVESLCGHLVELLANKIHAAAAAAVARAPSECRVEETSVSPLLISRPHRRRSSRGPQLAEVWSRRRSSAHCSAAVVVTLHLARQSVLIRTVEC